MALVERSLNALLPDDLVTRRDAAAILGLSPEGLRFWARLQRGPPVVYVKGRCYYRFGDLQAHRSQRAAMHQLRGPPGTGATPDAVHASRAATGVPGVSQPQHIASDVPGEGKAGP